MNVQIFGIKKCQATRKAERYFKERGIDFHFIDLTVRGLSKGELSSVKNAVGGFDRLIDGESKEYARLNLKYMVHDPETELLTHPLIMRTPLVRNGSKATLGYCPEIWQEWS